MRKLLLLAGSIYLALIFLMPKEELFYTLETFLKDQKVMIVKESIKDRLFDLKIKDVKLFYDGIETAQIDNITVKPWLFYNSVVAKNLSSGKDIKKMFDFKGEYVRLVQAFWHPFVAKIEAKGNFGKIWGKIFLKEGKIKLICEPEKSFKRSQIFRELFKKRDEGYVYESVIK